MTPFDEFWAVWPKGMRKVSKQLCERKWKNRCMDDEAETIIAHVKYMKTTQDWRKDDGAFVPMPLTYLNQMRWDGAEIPPAEEFMQIDREAIYKRQLEESIRAFK
jgi:hypothetical protein